jgi:hypothetical protein
MRLVANSLAPAIGNGATSLPMKSDRYGAKVLRTKGLAETGWLDLE